MLETKIDHKISDSNNWDKIKDKLSLQGERTLLEFIKHFEPLFLSFDDALSSISSNGEFYGKALMKIYKDKITIN